MVLGIVAVVAAPRFMSTDTYTEFALQQRLQTALRTLQIQSMYDTRPNFCYQLNFDSGARPGYGPATDNYQAGQQSLSCATSIDYTLPRYLRSNLDELSSDDIALLALDSGMPINFIQFNALGQPSTSQGACAGGCEISFTGNATATLCVSSEGYVHAC
jgi:MSHA pilin protein MshC